MEAVLLRLGALEQELKSNATTTEPKSMRSGIRSGAPPKGIDSSMPSGDRFRTTTSAGYRARAKRDVELYNGIMKAYPAQLWEDYIAGENNIFFSPKCTEENRDECAYDFDNTELEYDNFGAEKYTYTQMGARVLYYAHEFLVARDDINTIQQSVMNYEKGKECDMVELKTLPDLKNKMYHAKRQVRQLSYTMALHLLKQSPQEDPECLSHRDPSPAFLYAFLRNLKKSTLESFDAFGVKVNSINNGVTP